MGKYLSKILGLTILIGLVFSTSFGHAVIGRSMTGMLGSRCQTICPQQTLATRIKPQELLRNKNLEPDPQEPFYLAFIGVGWTTAIALATSYLLKYLRWRPPDLFKLNVSYRF